MFYYFKLYVKILKIFINEKNIGYEYFKGDYKSMIDIIYKNVTDKEININIQKELEEDEEKEIFKKN